VTSDDTGDMQHYFLEDMEGHIFLSPYKESDQTYLNALQMTVTAYSDIASPVTLEAQVSNNNDINYDVKVRGHRIRHKYTFDRAGWIMNGLVEYYKSTDSRTKNNSKDYEKAIQDVLANPIYGISIYEKHYNIAIDKAVVGSDFFGAEVDPIQMVVIPVLPGPDGKHMGLMFGYLQYCVKSDPIKAVLYGPWTFNFWIYTGGGCGGLGMIFKLIPYAEGMITSNQLRFDQSGYVAMTSEYGADSGHLPVPSDGNWHFVSISYLGANHALLGQVDMGAVIQLEAAGGDWGNKFLLGTDTGVDYPIISSINPIFDIRVFNIGLSQAQLNYYYQDVLAGGARTLPLV
jgi:hypothetical protein